MQDSVGKQENAVEGLSKDRPLLNLGDGKTESRLLTEFQVLGAIGSGGFGQVIKVPLQLLSMRVGVFVLSLNLCLLHFTVYFAGEEQVGWELVRHQKNTLEPEEQAAEQEDFAGSPAAL